MAPRTDLWLNAISSARRIPVVEPLRLAGAVLGETHDEWAVTGRRYVSEASMTAVSTTRAPPVSDR